MKNVFIFFVVALFFACGSPKSLKSGSAQKDFYECKGNEPYWSITMEVDVIIFSELGQDKLYFPYRDAQKIDGKVIFKTYIQEGNKSTRLQLTITEEPCTDAMSGETFPYSVIAEKDGENYMGCAK